MPNWTFKPQQLDFIGSPDQFPAYVAGVGTGKTTSLIAKAIMHCKESAKNLGMIVRKNFVDLRDSTMRDFRDYTGMPINADTKEVKIHDSVLMFRHGDELPVLKNVSLGFFGVEQAEEFQDDTTWNFLIQRLRRPCKFRSGFLIANANGHNWIYDKWIKDGPQENHDLIEATTYDFADILPPDYIRNLEQNLPKKLFRRYVLNSHEEAEGLVYDEFLESRDVVEPFEVPDTWERGFVIDHGFRNPTAVSWYCVDYDGTIYVYQEHYEKEQPISHHAQRIKEMDNLRKGICDPSMLARTQQRGDYVYSIADEYRDLGITLLPAFRSKEEASIARVNEWFKKGQLKIFKNCTNHIEEVKNWKWKEVKPTVMMRNLPEVPEDKDNHACDNIKYLIASRVQRPIKAVKQTKMYTPAWYLEEKRKKQTAKYSTVGLGRIRR